MKLYVKFGRKSNPKQFKYFANRMNKVAAEFEDKVWYGIYAKLVLTA